MELFVEVMSCCIDVGEVMFYVVEVGLEDGEFVVFFYGFLECWYVWVDYFCLFLEVGYWVVVFD